MLEIYTLVTPGGHVLEIYTLVTPGGHVLEIYTLVTPGCESGGRARDLHTCHTRWCESGGHVLEIYTLVTPGGVSHVVTC